MNIYTDWLHGTPSTITQWTLTGRGALKGNVPLHKGLFFTTNRTFAQGSGGWSDGGATAPNVYQANLIPGAHVLDISDPGVTCTFQESETLRKLVAARRPGKGNLQCETEKDWNIGWRTGRIMKYAPRPEDERRVFLVTQKLHTTDGRRAWNEIQTLTRDCIEDIVEASSIAGYKAVAGNEYQSGQKYPLLIVLDPSILTPPVKV